MFRTTRPAPSGPVPAPRAELDGAQARIAALEAELAAERTRSALATAVVAGVDAAPRGLGYADRASGWALTYANPFALQVLRGVEHHLGAPADAALGTPLPVLLPFPLFDRAVLDDPARLPRWDTYVVGQEWLESYVAPARNAAGAYIGVFIAIMPVSKRMRALQAVDASRSQIEAAIAEISATAQEAVAVAAGAVAASDEATALMNRLGTSSSEIGGVLQVISGVAAQTNLLALNATIEAARAGEAGKGFAVVASEVKDLAKESGSATEQVRQRIADIQSDAVAAVGAVSSVAEVIHAVDGLQGRIAAAVVQQSALMDELHASVTAAFG